MDNSRVCKSLKAVNTLLASHNHSLLAFPSTPACTLSAFRCISHDLPPAPTSIFPLPSLKAVRTPPQNTSSSSPSSLISSVYNTEQPTPSPSSRELELLPTNLEPLHPSPEKRTRGSDLSIHGVAARSSSGPGQFRREAHSPSQDHRAVKVDHRDTKIPRPTFGSCLPINLSRNSVRGEECVWNVFACFPIIDTAGWSNVPLDAPGRRQEWRDPGAGLEATCGGRACFASGVDWNEVTWRGTFQLWT